MPAIGQPSDYNTGPSRDWNKITSAEPIWHEEPFQLNPQRIPVVLATKQRPLTMQTPVVGIPLQRVPVMVRLSNQSPVEQGTGPQGSVWNMSDPGAHNYLAGLGDTYLDNAVPADASNPINAPAPTPAPAQVAAAPSSTDWNMLIRAGLLLGVVVYMYKSTNKYNRPF